MPEETWAALREARNEIGRLRAQLDSAYRSNLWMQRRAARVREVCASPLDERTWSHQVFAAVREALDGPIEGEPDEPCSHAPEGER